MNEVMPLLDSQRFQLFYSAGKHVPRTRILGVKKGGQMGSDFIIFLIPSRNMHSADDANHSQLMKSIDDLLHAIDNSHNPTQESCLIENGPVIGPLCAMESDQLYQNSARTLSLDCRYASYGCLRRFSAARNEQMHSPAYKFAARTAEHPIEQSGWCELRYFSTIIN